MIDITQISKKTRILSIIMNSNHIHTDTSYYAVIFSFSRYTVVFMVYSINAYE